MSRSYRHFPCAFLVGPASTAGWKRSYNRAIRRVNRYRLSVWWEVPDLTFTDKTERANPWSSPRDGTVFYWPAPHLGPFRNWGGSRAFSWLEHYRATRMK